MELAPRFSPVLVTGASGFIGAGLVRRLLAEGLAVHVVLRPEAQLWRLAGVLDRLTVHHADLLDAEATSAVIAAVRPAVVLHLAAYGAYESQADGGRILETTVLAGHHLLAASVASGVAVFVNAGSSSEYGYKDEPMGEADRLEPNSVYAVGKAAMTHLCSLIGRTQEKTAVTTLRLFSVYGPWEEPTRLVPTLLRRTRAGLPLEMVSPTIARDYVYLDDVLDAFLALPTLATFRGEVLNIGSGVQTTLQEVVETVQDVLGRRTEVRWGAMPPRRWDTSCWQAAPQRALERLGWRARRSLREGLALTAVWDEEEERVPHAD